MHKKWHAYSIQCDITAQHIPSRVMFGMQLLDVYRRQEDKQAKPSSVMDQFVSQWSALTDIPQHIQLHLLSQSLIYC
jgi:hypothetical protein